MGHDIQWFLIEPLALTGGREGKFIILDTEDLLEHFGVFWVFYNLLIQKHTCMLYILIAIDHNIQWKQAIPNSVFSLITINFYSMCVTS